MALQSLCLALTTGPGQSLLLSWPPLFSIRLNLFSVCTFPAQNKGNDTLSSQFCEMHSSKDFIPLSWMFTPILSLEAKVYCAKWVKLILGRLEFYWRFWRPILCRISTIYNHRTMTLWLWLLFLFLLLIIIIIIIVVVVVMKNNNSADDDDVNATILLLIQFMEKYLFLYTTKFRNGARM